MPSIVRGTFGSDTNTFAASKTPTARHESNPGCFADFYSRKIVEESSLFTTGMMPLSSENGFLVSCKGSRNQFLLVKDGFQPKPVSIFGSSFTEITALTENNGNMLFSDKNNRISFGKLTQDYEEGMVIEIYDEIAADESFNKIMFSTKDDGKYICKNSESLKIRLIGENEYCESVSLSGVVNDFDMASLQPNLLVYSGQRLGLIDLRMRDDRHRSVLQLNLPSKLVRWNPFVPYWVAFSTTSAVNVVDLRFNSPKPMINISHSSVNQLCWSNSNCDLLLAASKDRRMNLWSIGLEAEGSRLSCSANQAVFSSLHPASDDLNIFYGLSEADELVKVEVKSEYLCAVAPYRSDELEIRRIEAALYMRDFTGLYEELVNYSNNFKSENFKKLKSLVRQIFPANPLVAVIEDYGKSISQAERREEFKKILEMFSCSLPPQFENNRFNILKDVKLRDMIDGIKLKVRCCELIDSGDAETLLKFEAAIIQGIAGNAHFLNHEYSMKLLLLIIQHDRLKGIQFALKYANKYYGKFGNNPLLQCWLWICVYPTIFDRKSVELMKGPPVVAQQTGKNNKTEVQSGELKTPGEEKMQSVPPMPSLCPNSRPGKKMGNSVAEIRVHFYAHFFDEKYKREAKEIILKIANRFKGTSTTIIKILEFEAVMQESLHDLVKQVEICKKYFEQKDSGEMFISALGIKRLLEDALERTSLNQFFSTAFSLIKLNKATPFGAAIDDYNSKIGIPRLKFYLSQAGDRAHTLGTIKALNLIVNLVADENTVFPENLQNYLTDRLRKLVRYADFTGSGNEELECLKEQLYTLDVQVVASTGRFTSALMHEVAALKSLLLTASPILTHKQRQASLSRLSIK